MKSKKIIKKQLRDKQIAEDKKFRRYIIIGFSTLILIVISINVFFVFWCDVKFTYRVLTLYGNEVAPDLICMHGNKLEHHESLKVVKENQTFYLCGAATCRQHFKNHFREVAYTTDAFSGDTICKADALIGLKEKGQPNVAYFKNRQSFNKYYEARK